MQRWLSEVAAAVFVCVLLNVPAYGQQGTGELRGQVVDAQGAVLPGATVVATNEASGMFRESITGPDGGFFMSAMTPGVYEVTAQLSGFKKYARKGFRVEVGKTLSVEVVLEIGAIEESITVTAAYPIVDTTSTTMGGSMTATTLRE